MSSGRPRAVSNVHFFVSYQSEVVNKQLFSPISWKNPLSKIKFHSLIPLKINSSFMGKLCIRHQSVKWSENFLYSNNTFLCWEAKSRIFYCLKGKNHKFVRMNLLAEIFLFLCVFFSKQKIYILIHIRLTWAGRW